MGTVCMIKQILRLPGDNIRVLVEGRSRALAHQFVNPTRDDGCIYAEVEELEDYFEGVTERRAQALVRTAQERFAEYAQHAARISSEDVYKRQSITCAIRIRRLRCGYTRITASAREMRRRL